MSLYERIDRHAAPKTKDSIEHLAVYAICFGVLLLPVALRRLNPWSARRAQGLSVFGETSAMASTCASSSFMGM